MERVSRGGFGLTQAISFLSGARKVSRRFHVEFLLRVSGTDVCLDMSGERTILNILGMHPSWSNSYQTASRVSGIERRG